MADASGSMAAFRSRIMASLTRAEALVTKQAGDLDIDVVVQEMSGHVIPELGFVGYAPTAWLVHLTFDSANENLAHNLDEPLARTIVHEANHVLRWRGPGYGETLGGALVSEGLAGHFTREIFGNSPEPWEAPQADDLDFAEEILREWSAPYNHADWFFGAGVYPAWLGYRMGYRIVGQHMVRTGETATALTATPADVFSDTLRKMVA